jgi:hypothetical protein
MVNSQLCEISEEQWVSEVAEFARRSGEQSLFVRVRIAYVQVFSRVYRLEVHGRCPRDAA